jgi:imidazolonepropionase-like amidohydrolase
MDATRLIVRAALVIPATGEPAIRDGAVVIRNGSIERVGRASDLATSFPDGEVATYADGTVLPGLVDAHVHLTLPGDGRPYHEVAVEPDEMMVLQAVRNAWLHLAAGVTTVRDNGARGRTAFMVREARDRGYFPGPRMLVCGRALTMTGGHFHFFGGVADGPDEIRALVRQLVSEGADHIKIMASGGGTEGTFPGRASYTVEELQAAVGIAHDLGRLTTAHCRARTSMANALEAGVDCIEHGEFLVPAVGHGSPLAFRAEYDPELVERLLNQGIYVSYTFQAFGHGTLLDLERKQGEVGLDPDETLTLARLREALDMRTDIFGRLLGDGFGPRLVSSSDAGPFAERFGRPHLGLELAVRAGMEPIQAIESATRIAADACGVGDRVGTLTPGKLADLLIVRGDPTVDIRSIADIAAVYMDGVRVVPATA